MSAVVHSDEAAWRIARRDGIGASDVPTILGLTEPDAPWHKTVHELWAEKAGVVEDDRSFDEQVNEWRYWGLRLEQVIADEYALRTGRPVTRTSPFTIVAHPDYPWLRATLDATTVIGDCQRAPLQLKTAGQTQRKKWLKTDRRTRQIVERMTPLDYQCQSQIEQFIVGASVGSFAVLIGGNSFEHRDVPFDAAFLAAALPILERFWRHVETKTELPERFPS